MRRPIENFFALSTHILKKSLKKARDGELIEEEYLNFLDPNTKKDSVLFYSIRKDFEDRLYLEINYSGEPQNISLLEKELSFGTRYYFICGCGRPVNALYLKLDSLLCRHCHMLSYGSTRINTSSDYGVMLQRDAKRLKLIARRERIRPMYNRKTTNTLLKWARDCNKIGIFVDDNQLKLLETNNAGQNESNGLRRFQ